MAQGVSGTEVKETLYVKNPSQVPGIINKPRITIPVGAACTDWSPLLDDA